MATFTPAETAYLAEQRLARLATAGRNGRPHVVPVSFRHNVELGTIDVGGYNFGKRKKFRDVQENPWAAIVVDDIVAVDPWTVRMLEVRGRAEALTSGGSALSPGFAEEMIRIHPDRVVSYGLNGG